MPLKDGAKCRAVSSSKFPDSDALDKVDADAGTFLRANGQMHGYLLQRAGEIEKYGTFFMFHKFFDFACCFFDSRGLYFQARKFISSKCS